MSLLHLDKDISLKLIKHEFNLETGLDIEFYINKTKVENHDICLSEYWTKKFSNNLVVKLPPRMFSFCLESPINFELDLKQMFDIEAKIVDKHGIIKTISINRQRSKIDFEKLKLLNKRLIAIEKEIIKDGELLDKELSSRLKKNGGDLEDYELELEVSYYLDENDQLCNDSYDNIVAINHDMLKGISQKTSDYWGIGDGNNHLEHGRIFSENEFHCWLFHDLYDHQHLELEDIQRINRIWFDIIAYHQKFSENP